jgi:hypothetical protein
MAALVTNTVDNAVVTPTAAGVPDSSVTITPGRGRLYVVTVGATSTTITINRYGTNPSGDTKADFVITSVTNTRRIIPMTSEFVNPATGNAIVDFSQTTNVTAELLVVSS